MGVLIQATNGAPVGSDSVMAGLLQTNVVNLTLVPGTWNIVSWPYEASGILSNSLQNPYGTDETSLGFTNVDFAYIQPVGTNNPIQARWLKGKWSQSFNSSVVNDIGGMQLRAGDGIMYRAASGSTASWVPVVP
jgi:hypothetical protein